MDRSLSLSPSAAAPRRMQQQTAWLAREIRQPDAQAARHYVRSVRANVESVLQSCFVLTLDGLTPEALRTLVDGFVAHHGALDPAFHHIATECVRYVQDGHREGTLNWPRQRLALLEYEWACLCVEIDEGVVPAPGAGAVTAASPLWPNPTLLLLALPFAIHRNGVAASRQAQHLYALFRTVDHQVVTQRLRECDVALIQRLQQQPGITRQAFEEQLQQVHSDFDLAQWADHFYRLGLLTPASPLTNPDSDLSSPEQVSPDNIQGEFP